MRTEIKSPVSYRFGTFEVFPDSLELRKHGVRMKLREQAFRILVAMLERRGQLVTREELQRMLWSDDTFVDFDKGLNTAINTLREVLSDSAAQPRFIETIPRHGYRFIAEVEKRGSAAESESAPAPESIPNTHVAITATPDRITPAIPNRRHAAWLLTIAAGICITAVLLLVSQYNQPPATPVLGTPIQLTNDGIPKNELVTDGVRVYYASPVNRALSNWRTFYVSTSGGEPYELSSVREAMSPFAISADRGELMLGLSAIRQSNDGWGDQPERVWSQPVAGGPPRALALRAHDASWSPDGSELVFATTGHVGLARPDGTTIRMLADVPGAASGLRWSPKGDRIRFTLHYGGAMKDTAIWELSPHGGKAHPLFPNARNEQADGEWTPDGALYVFSQTNNGISQIWALIERTPSAWCPFCPLLQREPWSGKSKQLQVQLTTGPMQTFLPTPTPDGKRLLFYGVSKRSALVKRDGQSGRLEPFLPGISAGNVDFSRDGKWMAYSSYPERVIWRAAGDGSNRLQLSPHDMTAILPVMSPDGSKVAFLGWFPGQDASVFMVDTDGSGLQKVVSSSPTGIVEPSWSPDGKSLVLGSVKPNSALYRFDLANSNLSVMPGSEGLWSPRWSPDGRFVAALGSPVRNLMLYDLNLHQQEQLAPAPADYPSWSHDGQYVYFRDKAWRRVGLKRSVVEQITDLGLKGVGELPAMPSRGMPAWIGWWTALAPDDSLLTTAEAGSIEIYSAPLTRR